MSNTIKVTPYRSIEPTRIFFLYVVLILILFIILTIILISFFLEAFHGNKDSGSDSEPESGSQPEPDPESNSQPEPESNSQPEPESNSQPESELESSFEPELEIDSETEEEILGLVDNGARRSSVLQALEKIRQARLAELERNLEWEKRDGQDTSATPNRVKAALLFRGLKGLK